MLVRWNERRNDGEALHASHGTATALFPSVGAPRTEPLFAHTFNYLPRTSFDVGVSHRVAEGSLLMLLDQLDFLVRFWELKARHARQGEPLSATEQLELLSLLQLVSNDLSIPPRVREGATRDRGAIPVQLIGDGAMVIAQLRTVSAGALVVASSTTFEEGAILIVRVTDAVAGIEFSLPCTVAWSMRGAPDRMALVPDGIPSRARLVAPIGASAHFPMGGRSRPRMVG